jgi:hypothetical protein
MKPIPLLVIAGLFMGCSISPSVSYLEIKESETEGYTKFHLVEGSIVLSESEVKGENDTQIPKLESPAAKPSARITATVIPKEHRTLYALIPKRQWMGMVATNISASFYDNTRLIHKIGVEVIDNRIKVIEALGAGAKSIISMADDGKAPPGTDKDPSPSIVLPVIITPDAGGSTLETWQVVPNNEQTRWFFRLRKTSQAPPKDSIPTADFIEAHRESHWYDPISWLRETSVVPLSSCQDYSLEVSRPDVERPKELDKLSKDDLQNKLAQSKHKKVFGLRIPDPTRVITVRLPAKGELVTHTLCGGNVATQTDSTSSSYDLISSLIKQAQSLSESQWKNQD